MIGKGGRPCSNKSEKAERAYHTKKIAKMRKELENIIDPTERGRLRN